MEVYFGVVLIAEISPNSRSTVAHKRSRQSRRPRYTPTPIERSSPPTPTKTSGSSGSSRVTSARLVTSSCGLDASQGRGDLVGAVEGDDYGSRRVSAFLVDQFHDVRFCARGMGTCIKSASCEFHLAGLLEVPMPESPDRDLPPDGLRTFHFHCLSLESQNGTRSPGSDTELFQAEIPEGDSEDEDFCLDSAGDFDLEDSDPGATAGCSP